ncbi:MAG: hypothetical protein HYU67_03665 [Flavobacteriia bacterium]|nr:hypothetical protein [Flavobacteriia bacterium]
MIQFSFLNHLIRPISNPFNKAKELNLKNGESASNERDKKTKTLQHTARQTKQTMIRKLNIDKITVPRKK